MPAADGKCKIRLENLGKVFITERGEAVRVFEGLNAEFAEGEFVSIVGPSGIGKTTLVSLIAGLIQPSEGRVVIDGETVTGPGADRGVVFQQDSVFLWRSVVRNVEYGLEMAGIAPQERRRIAMDTLRLVGLERQAEFFPKELSGGMRKRVQLATVFANSPEVMLMDEPFGSLDYPTKVRLQQELLAMWERRRITTVFITHDLEEAILLADRVFAVRPDGIEPVLDVPFDRPRSEDLRVSSEIQVLKSKLWAYLGEPGAGKSESQNRAQGGQ